ncbi:MAG: pyridoxamine 5'-phosphate oxidase family protein [Nitrospirales bacterium]
MGKIFDSITDRLQMWMYEQKMFFVATAPLNETGHVNCSPKGSDSFRVLDKNTVAYQDLTGSGIETISHINENGRIVIMFCAFAGQPKIVRLHGRGEAIFPDHSEYNSLRKLFPVKPGIRSIIRVNVNRICDSCGFGVPLMDFVSDRDTLDRWSSSKSDDELLVYQQERNAVSIDGLSGILTPNNVAEKTQL